MADSGKFQIMDLAENLARAKGLQKREAQTFVRAFFNLILTALEEEKYVKISSLGTFKLIRVEPRESVDVNTGARILIESHPKITFTPDNKFKDLVNKPFSSFEPVDIEDDFDLSELESVMTGDQTSPGASDDIEAEGGVVEPVEPAGNSSSTEESAGNVEEVPSAPVAVAFEPQEEVPSVVEENQYQPEKEEEEIAPETISEEDVPDEPVQEEALEIPQPEVAETPVVPAAEESHAEPVMPVGAVESSPAMDNFQEEKKDGKSRLWLWIVLSVILLAAVCGVIAYLKFPELFEMDSDAVVHDKVMIERHKTDYRSVSADDKVKKDSVTQKVDSLSSAEAGGSSTRENVQEMPAKSETASSDIKYSYKKRYRITGTAGTYEVKPGESLRVIAGKVWGDRNMDSYITKHNNIESPDLIPVGAVLNIPALEEE